MVPVYPMEQCSAPVQEPLCGGVDRSPRLHPAPARPRYRSADQGLRARRLRGSRVTLDPGWVGADCRTLDPGGWMVKDLCLGKS